MQRYDAEIRANITTKHQVKTNIRTKNKPVSAEVRLPTVINEREAEKYDGETEITPSWENQTLETADKLVEDNIVVLSIKTYEVSNDAGGITLSI